MSFPSRETPPLFGTGRRREGFGILKLLLSLLFVLLVGAACLSAIGMVVYLKEVSSELPTAEDMLKHQPSLATVILDRKGRTICRLFQENRSWVPLAQISPWMTKSVLAAEDDEFYRHAGVRPTAILRALWIDLTHQKVRQGGSTITQQLVRNLFLSREQTLQRKVKEAILAFRMEKVYTKDQILEMYLNTIYMGHGAYGIGAAAQTYFGTSAQALTLGQATLLAGLIAAPEYYTPFRNPERTKERQTYVVRRMSELGWITPEQGNDVLAAPVRLSPARTSRMSIDEAPYFVTWLLFKQLLPTYGADGVYRGGLKIRTTLDLDVQHAAEAAMRRLRPEGAILALDPQTGEILAMVGGRSFKESKFNRAVQAYRQPGSAFKPIVYAAALENGYRPVDHMLDAPLLFPNGWSPQNYESGRYAGEVTFIEALGRSINTVAVRLAQTIGVESVVETARRMGISSPHVPNDLSLALGAASVTPLEVATAFACFANNGYQVKPFGIREIEGPDGEILERNGPDLSHALSPETAASLRSMLTQAVIWGTGRAAQIPGVETFGKTGTTNDYSDAWFVGGVPGLIAVVYVGHDNHRTLGGGASGGRVAAPIWRDFVSRAVRVLDTPKRFAVTGEANVVAVRVCRKTGFLATPSCPGVEILMNASVVPTATCPWHGGSALAARDDPNAPQLVLAPIDDDATRLRYALGSPGSGSGSGGGGGTAPTAEAGEQGTVPEEPIAPIPTKRPGDQGAAPPPPSVRPYQKDPSPANDVERRYQDLLKKYNISN
jgi:penicillin-binding protein 1A